MFNNSNFTLDVATFDGYIANHMTNCRDKGRKIVNGFGCLAIGTMLMFAATAPAQGEAPTVEQQLKVLTDKLDLTGDQQARIKPILHELRDGTEKLVQDKSLSHEERLTKVMPKRYEADKQIREVLSDEQKKKLDRFEQGPQAEMLHGNLHGNSSSRPQPSQTVK